jgi:hypothetical protein
MICGRCLRPIQGKSRTYLEKPYHADQDEQGNFQEPTSEKTCFVKTIKDRVLTRFFLGVNPDMSATASPRRSTPRASRGHARPFWTAQGL